MEKVILVDPSKPKSRKRSVPNVKQDVERILNGFPKGEEDWADGRPQSPTDVDELFDRVTLNGTPDRATMDCAKLLESFAEEAETQNPLHVATLAAAGVICMKLGQVNKNTVHNTMRKCLGDVKENQLEGMRLGVSRCVLFLDTIHPGFGSRTYELLFRRNKPFLNQAAHLGPDHFQYLRQYLADPDSNKLYKPELQLDSARLRIPNIIFTLFAEKYTREEIEKAFHIKGNPPPVPFYHFFPLDESFEGLRLEVIRELVGVAPSLEGVKFKRYGLSYSCPELCRFVKNQKLFMRWPRPII
ncbi:hypothetical protein BGZ63DRAFT_171156 [Mariannaea sp. PMI_226]|nr:hypothetical protein BGZ63DRAFT_171156 [Mariannaea sp. PMI_226]